MSACNTPKNTLTQHKNKLSEKKGHFFGSKCLTGEELSGNILEQLRRATTTKVLTTVEIIGNESNFVE